MSPRPIFRRVWLRIRALYRVTNAKLHGTRGFTVVEILIVVTIIGLLSVVAISGFNYVRKHAPPQWQAFANLHQAWVKAYHRPDLNYDEWYLLYRYELLPRDNVAISAPQPVEKL